MPKSDEDTTYYPDTDIPKSEENTIKKLNRPKFLIFFNL